MSIAIIPFNGVDHWTSRSLFEVRCRQPVGARFLHETCLSTEEFDLPATSRPVRQNIQYHPAWIAHMETPNSPNFIRQIIDNFRAEFPGFPVGLINIVHFDGYGWNLGSRAALGCDADLRCRWLVGGKGDDPTKVHGNVETKHAFIEGLGLFRVFHAEIGNDALDGHLPSIVR